MEDFGDTIGDNNNEILNNNYIGNNTNDDNDEAGRTAVFSYCQNWTRAGNTIPLLHQAHPQNLQTSSGASESLF